MKLGTLALTLSLATSCATTHINPESTSPVAGLIVSCAEHQGLNIQGYKGIQCTFDNKAPYTVRFKIVDMEFSSPEATLVHRSEAKDLMQAWQEQRDRDTHNRKVGAAAVMGLGLLAVIFGDASAANLGSAAVAGAAGYDAGADIADGLEELDYGRAGRYAYGEDLIYKKITVPSGMAIKKGFLVESVYDLYHIELCFNTDEDCQRYQL